VDESNPLIIFLILDGLDGWWFGGLNCHSHPIGKCMSIMNLTREGLGQR